MFEVSGRLHGVPVKTIYKRKAAALKFAEKLQESEVYCLSTQQYIAGSSKFVKALVSK